MTKKWYAETKGFNGEWKPCIFHQEDRPSEQTLTEKRSINNVNEITPELDELSVIELYEHFNGIVVSQAPVFKSTRTYKEVI